VATFAAQTSIAYFLMLIAMTYKGELFVAVIGGLALGHAAFNLRAPVPASADPCCQSLNADEPLPAMASLAMGQPIAALPSVFASGRRSDAYQPLPSPTTAMTAPLLATGHAGLVSYQLRVGGMVCASCEETVKRALAAVDGVTSVRVSLATEDAEVVCVNTVAAQALVQAVRNAGKDAFLK